MEERIRVAFLETHHPHMWHRVAILDSMQNVEILGFFDDDESTAQQFMQRTGWHRFQNAEDLLEEKPDIIFVESMDNAIPYYAKLAARAAKCVLVEKVGATSPEAVKALEDELSDFDVSIENGFQMNYMPVVKDCAKIASSGALGRITLVRFHGGCPVGCAADPWCNDPALSSGLVWLEGCHVLDIALELLGEPKTVTGLLAKLEKGDEVISTRVGMDLFKGAGEPTLTRIGALNHEDVGAAIALYDDKLAVFDFTAWESGPWCEEWKIEFYGTDGTMTARLFPERIELKLQNAFDDYPAGLSTIEYPLTDELGDSQMKNAYRRQIMHMIDMLKNGSKDQSGMRRMTDVALLAEKMY